MVAQLKESKLLLISESKAKYSSVTNCYEATCLMRNFETILLTPCSLIMMLIMLMLANLYVVFLNWKIVSTQKDSTGERKD